jgi:predicted phage terminase large subunit-like protein
MLDGASTGFTQEDIDLLLQNVDQLDERELAELDQIVGDLAERQRVQLLRDDLISFCCHMQDDYKVGAHHRRLADLLEDIEARRKDRICVSIPPRHGKSQLVSIYYAAWYMGRNPSHKVMLVSHTTDLAVDFGRKIRNLIATPKYRDVFPDVQLASDSKSAGRWNTNHGGEFFAAGVGSALAGRGAHLLLVDDPHSEQDILNGNYNVFDKAYEWFTFGARTRLMPGGAVAIVHTRWAQQDLIGRVIGDMTKQSGADQYEVFEFPAILTITDPDTGEKSERALWPEFFDIPALMRTKASMPTFQWNAQYQQSPTAEEAAVVKREWWRQWTRDQPPPCDYIIASLDAAAETHNRADYTSLTIWGVFLNEEEDHHQIILLHAIKERLEFPELKRMALEIYRDWQPDSFIVEKKSAGVALYQELRRMGLPIQEYTPHRGTGDKMARLNSVADIISSGMVWVPDRRWAEEVVEEIAAFPFGANDDHCFVAGTAISMADGSVRPIETLQEGDMVLTPAGPKEVQSSSFTGVRSTFTLRAGRHRLEGTGNHPIATTSGWKRLDTITLTDTIKVSKRGVITCHGLQNPVSLLNQCISMVASIIATPSRQGALCAPISGVGAGVESACTEQYGSTTMAPFPRGITSTTKMVTPTTMTSQTWSACLLENTQMCTPRKEVETVNVLSKLNIWQKYAKKLPIGTGLKRAESGTEKSLRRLLKKVARPMWHEKKSSHCKPPIPQSVFVRSVVRSFRRLLAKLVFVGMRVQVESLKESGEKKPVYNLSVADAHCYYANGVLVHNCDSTVMAMLRFRQGGFIVLPSDEIEEPEYSLPTREGYY